MSFSSLKAGTTIEIFTFNQEELRPCGQKILASGGLSLPFDAHIMYSIITDS